MWNTWDTQLLVGKRGLRCRSALSGSTGRANYMNYHEFPGSMLLRLDSSWPPNPWESRLVGNDNMEDPGCSRRNTFI